MEKELGNQPLNLPERIHEESVDNLDKDQEGSITGQSRTNIPDTPPINARVQGNTPRDCMWEYREVTRISIRVYL